MNKKYKIIIFASVLAILFNFVAKYYLINGQNKKIIMFQKDIASARSGSSFKSDLPLLPRLTNQDDINRIINKIPEEFSFTQYAAQLRALIDSNSLTIEKNLVFKPEKTEKSDLLKYNANIVVTGDYIKIKKFIADVLNLSGFVYFDAINFTRDRDNKDKIKFKFELSLFFKRGTA